jgi:hypothetical protein
MRAGFVLACILTFTVSDAATSATMQTRNTSQEVAETVVLTVRGMT